MPTKPLSAAPIAAEVRQDQESEAALVKRAKEAISDSNWKVGECASLWTERYARGRTDEDFGAAIGMSGDQVRQRRGVWERWGGISDMYPKLSWSHFYASMAWNDADRCMQWACDNEATVAEMKAWRSAENGLSQEADEFISEMGDVVDDYDDSDPFGEREGTGTDSWTETGSDAAGEDDGTETGGTDSEEERADRPPRNGREAPVRQKTKHEVFLELRAKTVKTAEALSRAIGDVHEVHPVPQKEAMIRAVRKMIDTAKSWE